jgi:HEAT repeat protein
VKTRSTLLFGGLLIAVSAIAFQVLRHSEPEPFYRGKRLSIWLAQGPLGFDDGADEFLRQNSALVTSYLIASLHHGDNPFWKPYMWLSRHAPALISKWMPPWMEPKLVRVGATYWLAQLGTRATAAVPDLCRAGSQDVHPEVRRSALWALGRVECPSKGTVALLVGALCREQDAGARQAAVGVLEVWAPDEPVVVLALIDRLKDSDALVRQMSAAALGKYGPRANAALGALNDLAAGDDPAADYAAHALQQIHKDKPPRPAPGD